MALKPGTREYEQWRKKNFNLNIRVPKSAVDKLLAGKTPSNNIRKYAGTNDRVMREAMNRFYGKGWESKAPAGTPKRSTPTTPPRNVPPSVTGGGKSKPNYGTNTPSPRIAEGKGKSVVIPKNAKVQAQKKLDAMMRSSSYRPTTSIGSFNPNARVLPSDFSYKKLNSGQKALVESILFSMLPVGAGVGLGIKALGAVRGAVTATKFAKAVKAEQAAADAAKAAKVAKTAKKAASAKKAAKKASKPPVKEAPKKTAKKAAEAPKKEPAKRGRPTTTGGNDPYGMRDYGDEAILNMAKSAGRNSRAWKEAKRRGLNPEAPVAKAIKKTAKPKTPKAGGDKGPKGQTSRNSKPNNKTAEGVAARKALIEEGRAKDIQLGKLLKKKKVDYPQVQKLVEELRALSKKLGAPVNEEKLKWILLDAKNRAM